MFCESDRASLCWDCDAKVHGANFLVARHLRYLLCQKCQSPTPWRAAGTKLGRTVSVCKSCVNGGVEAENKDVEIEIGDEESVEDNDDVEVNEEEGDNQVVPWSSVVNSPPPTTAASSSFSCQASGGEKEVSTFCLKRKPENSSDLRTQDFLSLMTSSDDLSRRRVEEEAEEFIADAIRPLKERRIESQESIHVSGSMPAAGVELLSKLGSKSKEFQNFDLNC